MDELEFRRRLMADPNSKDPDLKKYVEAHPERKSMVEELKRFDGEIEQALKIDVPENLAERIILRQSLNQAKKPRWHFDRVHLALAASLVLSISSMVYNHFQPPLTEGERALAHVYHEIKSLNSSERISLDEVNTQLAQFNGRLDTLPGEVRYATICDFKGQKSVHLVFNTDSGPVTLFIVPTHNAFIDKENFYHNQFAGLVSHEAKGDVILVASRHAPLARYQDEVSNSLRWL